MTFPTKIAASLLAVIFVLFYFHHEESGVKMISSVFRDMRRMVIGIPSEVQRDEERVGLTPEGVDVLTDYGHEVLVERGAGAASGIEDELYLQAGARLEEDSRRIWNQAEMIVKVQQPTLQEVTRMRREQILFTFLHLAAKRKLTEELLAREVVAIAYETVETEGGLLPLLTPMSEIAGRMSVQIGAHYLEKVHGGRGILLGGVPGLKPGRVCIIGGGRVGLNAAKIAIGMGADVSLLDINPKQLRYVDDIFKGQIDTLMSNRSQVAEEVAISDIVIAAAHIPGTKAPLVVEEDMVKTMKQGTVIADVAIDQGGCVENTYPVPHEEPVYTRHGVLHYSVTNIPGAVPRTATYALSNSTLPYILKLANKGYKRALREDSALLNGLNLCKGKVIYPTIAETFGLEHYSNEEVL